MNRQVKLFKYKFTCIYIYIYIYILHTAFFPNVIMFHSIAPHMHYRSAPLVSNRDLQSCLDQALEKLLIFRIYSPRHLVDELLLQ